MACTSTCTEEMTGAIPAAAGQDAIAPVISSVHVLVHATQGHVDSVDSYIS